MQDLKDEKGNTIYNFGKETIFQFADSNNPSIEEETSNFNQHRLAVIRYCIEKNLSIAIANYNNYAGGITTDFQMPRLKEDEWDKIVNNVCLISFLQGLNIGGKVYNGYSIITNNKTEEFVSEDSIYIIANGEYHKVTDRDLQGLREEDMSGQLNTVFERKSMELDNGTVVYYYPKTELGCYSSIVSQSGVVDTDNIYTYLSNYPEIAKVYYTALGRERYSMFRLNQITLQEKINNLI